MLGCDRIPRKPTEAQRTVVLTQVTDFGGLYGRYCAGCHGGDGQMGAARPLRDPLYLALVRQDTLRQIIAQGVPGTTMPAFAARFGGYKQIDILVDEMQTRWGRPQAFTGVALPPYSREDAIAAGAEPGDLERGKTVYTTYCAHCHGLDGRGGEQGGAVSDGVYLALVSDQALRTAVIAGRVDLRMPDWRETVAGRPITPQELTDVVTWLASHRQRMPGRSSGAGESRWRPWVVEPQEGRAAMAVQGPEQHRTTSLEMSRRGFLFALGVALNTVAATLLAIPIVGYVFSSFRYKTLQEWNVDSACISTEEGSLRQQIVEVVFTTRCKSSLRRSTWIIAVPFSREEPTQASSSLSVTTDVNCLCAVTAILPPSPPQTCHWIRCGKESCTG